jgi:DNA-binding response OmpR family regulator
MIAAPKKILVVDDEEDLVTLLAWNLRRSGYRVIPAFDGSMAVLKADEHSPDLILLDVMLPGSDGLVVLSRLRRREITRRVPIIMVTARRESSLIFESLRLGATDVMLKPFAMTEMMHWVARWLSGKGPGPDGRYAEGTLRSMAQ